MITRHLRHISLLIFSMLIAGLALYQMFMRTDGYVPRQWIIMLSAVGLFYFVWYGVTLKFQRYAAQTIMSCTLILTALGVTMIRRIDHENQTNVGYRQLMWTLLALVACCVLVIVLQNYRLLRQFSYVSMVIGLALLLSPMIPGLGRTVGGARIWIGIGSHTIQPSEFAKLFLAFFFASYLFDHRDQLAVGGKKILGMRMPRLKDLGPIIVVWVVSMGVLVMQRDLGTSLMFFAMFVSMLYVATGQRSWIVIGGVAFLIGCVLAVFLFRHVSARVDAWLHPFDNEIYNRLYGGSAQLVTGLFGIASGGLLGTGLGLGHPDLTPLSNSDFIYASLGEELGLAGTLMILVTYLIIITAGLLTAMRIKDGFGKLLAAGLVFTMAFQVFTVVGGITLVIPLTGLTLPYMAAGGSSLIANYLLAGLLLVLSHAANKPKPQALSDTMQQAAIVALRHNEDTRDAATSNNAEHDAATYVNEGRSTVVHSTNGHESATHGDTGRESSNTADSNTATTNTAGSNTATSSHPSETNKGGEQ